jgi:hypothetical protein
MVKVLAPIVSSPALNLKSVALMIIPAALVAICPALIAIQAALIGKNVAQLVSQAALVRFYHPLEAESGRHLGGNSLAPSAPSPATRPNRGNASALLKSAPTTKHH